MPLSPPLLWASAGVSTGPGTMTRPCTVPAPPTAQEPLDHQIKHPKYFQRRRGFISGFPEAVCHPTEQWRPQTGCWQSTVTREDALQFTPSLPAGAPTVPSSWVPPQGCLSLRLSLGSRPHTCQGFLDIKTPQASPVMHLYFLVHCWCPAALHVPAVPQGHWSPSTALITSEPCGCTVASLPAEPPEPWPHMSSFCPKTHSLSSREQQGQVQLRIHTSPSIFGSFLSSSQCSGVPGFCHSHPTANQPASPSHRWWIQSLGTAWSRRMNSSWASAGSNPFALEAELVPGPQTSRWQPRCWSSTSPRRAASLRVPGRLAGSVQGVELLPAGRQPLRPPADLPQLFPPAAGRPSPGLCGGAARGALRAVSRNPPLHTTEMLVRGKKPPHAGSAQLRWPNCLYGHGKDMVSGPQEVPQVAVPV